ncbi:TPA: pheST operon leader peptide PheM [Citrobacter freundii]|nr:MULTISPECIES: pheST operon leader peptide PheM [Enterobacterales]MDM7140097.1 pheST operon leader peptide PheM [Klebsiella pneumoniae]
MNPAIFRFFFYFST